MLVGRPRLCRPTVRMEVALGRAVERRVLGVLAAMMVLDMLQSLAEVFVVVGLASVSLEDDMREEGC